MNEYIAAIVGRNEDQEFRDSLLDLVTRTGHEFIKADHLLAALLLDRTTPQHRHLIRERLMPQELSSIIVDNLPVVDEPGLPPIKISESTLDPAFIECCNRSGYQNMGEALLDNLSLPVREILEFGSVIETLRAAFTTDGQGPPQSSAKLDFFTPEGEINREIFTAQALSAIAAVEKTSKELGYTKISLPQLFVGLASQGIFKTYLNGFGSTQASAIEHISRHISKGARTEGVRFTRDTISGSVTNFVNLVVRLAAEQSAKAVTEVLLLVAFCQLDSELLAGYWRFCRLVPDHTRRMISLMKDESPVNPPQEPAVPDFDSIVERLRDRIVGQAQAISQIMPIVRKWMLGIYFENRPAGVVLFMGPPGVGKTELAKELAEILYADRKKLGTIEMNQMQQEHMVSKLIGAPPGYRGPQSGKLTDWIAQNPKSIILFDEIEKAHQNSFEVLLRLLSEGQIQDAYGREYDATRNLIIMTSNIGQNEGIFESIAFQRQQNERNEENPLTDSTIKALLARHFAPEFISRLINVVLFNPLGEEAFLQIAKNAVAKAIAEMTPQLRQAKIEIEERVYPHLAQQARQQGQGARAFRGLVDIEIVDRLIVHLSKSPEAKQLTIACRGAEIEVIG